MNIKKGLSFASALVFAAACASANAAVPVALPGLNSIPALPISTLPSLPLSSLGSLTSILHSSGAGGLPVAGLPGLGSLTTLLPLSSLSSLPLSGLGGLPGLGNLPLLSFINTSTAGLAVLTNTLNGTSLVTGPGSLLLTSGLAIPSVP